MLSPQDRLIGGNSSLESEQGHSRTMQDVIECPGGFQYVPELLKPFRNGMQYLANAVPERHLGRLKSKKSTPGVVAYPSPLIG